MSSFAAVHAALTAEMGELHQAGIAALEQCRRRSRSQLRLIGDRIPDVTDPDWRVSVPGSGYGSGGGLGTQDPTDVPSTPGQSANDPRRNSGE